MKKKLLRKSTNGFLVILTAVLISCSKLEVSEANFTRKHITDFDGLSQFIDIEPIPEKTAKRLFSDHGLTGEDLENALASNPRFYTWQTTGSLTEFTVYTSDGCISEVTYFVYADQEYKDSKVISSLSDCADGRIVKSGKIDGNSFSITSTTNIASEVRAVFNEEITEYCQLNSEGKFVCDEPFSTYPGLSLWNGLALRETPERSGNFITRVNIGETFKTADSVDVSSDDEYIFVELKGGTSGYILNRLVMPKAVPYAIQYDAIIYSRPDDLTRTDKTFKRMDIVGLTEVDSDGIWHKVKGRSPGDKWFKEGWIKNGFGTRNERDVAVASLVNRALEETDEAKRHQLLRDIQTNPELQEAYLIQHVSNYLPGM